MLKREKGKHPDFKKPSRRGMGLLYVPRLSRARLRDAGCSSRETPGAKRLLSQGNHLRCWKTILPINQLVLSLRTGLVSDAGSILHTKPQLYQDPPGSKRACAQPSAALASGWAVKAASRL